MRSWRTASCSPIRSISSSIDSPSGELEQREGEDLAARRRGSRPVIGPQPSSQPKPLSGYQACDEVLVGLALAEAADEDRAEGLSLAHVRTISQSFENAIALVRDHPVPAAPQMHVVDALAADPDHVVADASGDASAPVPPLSMSGAVVPEIRSLPASRRCSRGPRARRSGRVPRLPLDPIGAEAAEDRAVRGEGRRLLVRAFLVS